MEVFQNSERLYTSVSQDNMEHIKSFAASEDRVVEIPLNVMVNGNVIVVVHHIRAVPADKMSGMVSGGLYMLLGMPVAMGTICMLCLYVCDGSVGK